jgi:glycerol-3-phosphate dehydrogenase
MRCAARCGQIVADATGQSPAEGRRMALRFLSGAVKRRLPVIGPEQARQEALALASLRAELGSELDGD